ncbi:beta-Ala-His dipeptidase [Pseudobacillus wudalianchiensis]|uniref:Cytosol non-specific dipeptidase n=1 Tax=Pseudobacillus wudalianchiensis TaxID=1743143 RepID=A0A1B9B2I0_9BACI|nr:beta-Ala-His dipeptidase [Bacillus wudalianchiensis]OCA90305.1 aminoacyl-histidine dipeptidase [Bacillus wudalianchiensis]
MFSRLHELTQFTVFHYFAEVSKIRRRSGQEKEISDFLVQFAKDHHLEVIQDQALNITIKKQATSGYEQAPTVIIQGPMDMIEDKNEDAEHDFAKDPLQLRIEGDMLYATETTLGANSGIALAYSLSLLSSNRIPHPNLEVILTTEGRLTMKGARELDISHLNGTILINLDSDEFGKLLVSGSGGIASTFTVPIIWNEAAKNKILCRIHIGGLKGGHSGLCINQGRGNSIKLLGRILQRLSAKMDFSLAGLAGGTKDTSIPREAEAFVLIQAEKIGQLEAEVEQWNQIFKNELRHSDGQVFAQVTKEEEVFLKVFSKETTEKLIAALLLLPSGVENMSLDFPGLVESSASLGVVNTYATAITFESFIRSSEKSLKDKMINEMKILANVLGSEVTFGYDYPEWPYNPDSKIKSLFEMVYKEKYGENIESIAIHAGLECGLFLEKMDFDAISIGPDVYNSHTPNEHLSISSTLKTWEYLLAVLKEIHAIELIGPQSKFNTDPPLWIG